MDYALKEAPIVQYLITKIPYYSELNKLIISFLNTLLFTCLVDESPSDRLHNSIAYKLYVLSNGLSNTITLGFYAKKVFINIVKNKTVVAFNTTSFMAYIHNIFRMQILHEFRAPNTQGVYKVAATHMFFV